MNSASFTAIEAYAMSFYIFICNAVGIILSVSECMVNDCMWDGLIFFFMLALRRFCSLVLWGVMIDLSYFINLFGVVIRVRKYCLLLSASVKIRIFYGCSLVAIFYV